MTPDFINGCFEFFGGVLTLFSVRRVLIDKMVRGVSLAPIAFFTVWGAWNLIFYPWYGLWYSFWGGALIVAANAVWVGLLFYYEWER